MLVWRPPHPRRHSSSQRSVLSGSHSSCWPNSTRYRPRSAPSPSAPGCTSRALAVLILSLATLALSPFLGDSLRIIGADPVTAALFVIGSVATMGAPQFRNAAIGLHRGSAQLWRGGLNSVLKLAIVGVLVLVGTRTAPGLLFAWALALVVSLVVCIPCFDSNRPRPAKGDLSHRGALARTLRRALPQAPRPQSVDQFHLLHRCADCSAPDAPAATGLLLDRAPVVVHRHDHPVPAGAVPVRRDIRRPEPPPSSPRPPNTPPGTGPVWWDLGRRRSGGSPHPAASSAPPTSRTGPLHCAFSRWWAPPTWSRTTTWRSAARRVA